MSYTNAPRNASYTPRPASEKQIGFIKTLLSEREVDEQIAAYVSNRIDSGLLTSKEASGQIDVLLPLPKKAPVVDGGGKGLDGLLPLIPVSRYAIPVKDVETWLTETNTYTNDMLFAEVSKGRYGRSKGRLFLNRLAGGYGGFARLRFSGEDALTIARYLGDGDRALAAAQRFGSLHNQCGVCGADLTDEVSRSLSLGPTCRQRFGLK